MIALLQLLLRAEISYSKEFVKAGASQKMLRTVVFQALTFLSVLSNRSSKTKSMNKAVTSEFGTTLVHKKKIKKCGTRFSQEKIELISSSLIILLRL